MPLLLVLVLLAPAQGTPAVPPCPIAATEGFGITREAPIPIGGGPMYFAARQRRYLESLRGPEGQPLKYRRIGSTKGVDETILDSYEVSYEGLEKPLLLFLDGYHYGEPKVPAGFTCGAPLALGMPPADPFKGGDQVLAHAVTAGAIRDFEPIALGTEGSAPQVLLFDHFRLVARAARAAAAAGRPLDPAALPAELSTNRMAVVALAQSCGDRMVPPTAVEIISTRGTPPQRIGAELTAAGIARMIPGYAAPDGSHAAAFALPILRSVDQVRVTYAEACAGAATQVTFPTRFTPARPLETPLAPLPPGEQVPDDAVYLQVVIDPNGSFALPERIGGPKHLLAAAIEWLPKWKAEPPRLNGAPYVIPVVLKVGFAQK